MRKLSGLIVLVLLGVVLVACGTEEDDPEPTAPPQQTRIVEGEQGESGEVDAPATVPAATVTVTVASTPSLDEASPPVAGATPVASPEARVAVSPVASPMASPVASPVMTTEANGAPAASPVASPMATPEGARMIAEPINGPSTGVGTQEPADAPAMLELRGSVVLNGSENEAYIITSDGCIGLGEYANLRDGRQVVIRNEAGTIVAVSDLGPATETNGCSWGFVAQVPESDFYSVSIPLTFERVFPNAQVSEDGGAVTIELP